MQNKLLNELNDKHLHTYFAPPFAQQLKNQPKHSALSHVKRKQRIKEEATHIDRIGKLNDIRFIHTNQISIWFMYVQLINMCITNFTDWHRNKQHSNPLLKNFFWHINEIYTKLYIQWKKKASFFLCVSNQTYKSLLNKQSKQTNSKTISLMDIHGN